MAPTDSPFPCHLPSGHADWAVHLLGYLSASPHAVVRQELLAGLVSANDAYPLPAVALQKWMDLELLDQDDDASPF